MNLLSDVLSSLCGKIIIIKSGVSLGERCTSVCTTTFIHFDVALCQADTRRWINVGLALVHRLRYWLSYLDIIWSMISSLPMPIPQSAGDPQMIHGVVNLMRKA